MGASESAVIAGNESGVMVGNESGTGVGSESGGPATADPVACRTAAGTAPPNPAAAVQNDSRRRKMIRFRCAGRKIR